MRRLILISLALVSVGSAALAATPVDRAVDLAELRLEVPELREQTAQAKAIADNLQQALGKSLAELNELLADQMVALQELDRVEDELRAARSRFDEGIERLYIRGGTAAVTVVMFFDDPTEAGIATHYLEAVNASEMDALADIEEYVDLGRDLRYRAFDAVELAETDYADRERAFVLAVGRLAELESELLRLEARIDHLTEDWRQYRLSLAEDIIASTGARGVLATTTREQAELRASLPLGPTVGVPPGLEPTGEVLTGVASWYGPGFHGRRASSGAIFDERDFTLAHKTLAHGTILLVTYREKQVVLMVNDRGPFIEGREFDLSRAAAEYLGLGLGRVEAEILVPAS